MISVFTCFSFARSRLLSVTRRTQNRPRLVTAQMCVNPRNENVSGFPSPRAFLLGTAYRPNSISRVFRPGTEPDGEIVGETHDDHVTVSGCSSRPNSANCSRSAAWNSSASS